MSTDTNVTVPPTAEPGAPLRHVRQATAAEISDALQHYTSAVDERNELYRAGFTSFMQPLASGGYQFTIERQSAHAAPRLWAHHNKGLCLCIHTGGWGVETPGYIGKTRRGRRYQLNPVRDDQIIYAWVYEAARERPRV